MILIYLCARVVGCMGVCVHVSICLAVMAAGSDIAPDNDTPLTTQPFSRRTARNLEPVPLTRSHSTQHGADGCVAIVSSPVTRHPQASSPLPRSVFLSRTVSSPLLDRLCPLTTVVKGRAAQTKHRHDAGRHSHQWRVTRFRQTQPTPLFPSVFPLHRTDSRENSSAQLSTAHSAHQTHSGTCPRTHFRPPSTADTSEPAGPVQQ